MAPQKTGMDPPEGPAGIENEAADAQQPAPDQARVQQEQPPPPAPYPEQERGRPGAPQQQQQQQPQVPQPPAGTTPEELGGRTLHRLPPGHLMTQEQMATQPADPFNAYEAQQAAAAPMQEEAAGMIPDFIRQREAQEEQRSGPQAGAGVPTDDTAIKAVSEQLQEAREAGDEITVRALQSVLDRLLGKSELQQVHEAKADHPVLGKLKSQLGLERIKPVTIPWSGFKWHFQAIPSTLDGWVQEVVNSGAMSYAEAKISAALVGIDNTPLFEVLGVPLVIKWEGSVFQEAVEAGEMQPGDDPPISAPLYPKYCKACRAEVEHSDTDCKACGSHLDVYDMPLLLRLRCAQEMHTFFTEDFGPYEQLVHLYGKMRDQMPDRARNQEVLYPFIEKYQPPSKATPTSPSGDE